MKDLTEAIRILSVIWPAIAAYHDDVILVGGTAAHLYGLAEDFQESGMLRALSTVDVDIGVPQPLAYRGGGPLVEMLAQAGFRATPRTTGSNATRIDLPGLGADGADPYIEFLTPANTSFAGDDAVQDGLRAHLSPYAWMLFVDPIRIALPGGPHQVRLPHPLSYAAQKTLIAHTTRPLDKRSKDFADALHVLGGFRSTWPAIFAHHQALTRAHPSGPEHLVQALGIWATQFGSPGRLTPGAALVGQRLAGGDPEQMPMLRALADRIGRDVLRAWRTATATAPGA